jgi:type IV secretion system protein VirB5
VPHVFYSNDGTNGTAFSQDDNNLELADTVNGIAQKNARMWQIIALVSLSSFFISLGILIYAVNLPKTVPVVVTVNPEGEAAYIGKINKSQYKNYIPDIAKEYQIRRFLTKMHLWVIDREAQQSYVGEAMSVVQGSAIRELDIFFRANNPFTSLGDKTRSIVFEPLLKQTEKTYVVFFTTVEKNKSGFETVKIRWSALVNIDLYEPSPENPLGIFITNFDIKPMEEKR